MNTAKIGPAVPTRSVHGNNCTVASLTKKASRGNQSEFSECNWNANTSCQPLTSLSSLVNMAEPR